jgi:hypothetical protein
MNKVEDRGYHIFLANKKKDFLLEKEAFKNIIKDISIIPKVTTELFGGMGLFCSLRPNSWLDKVYITYDHDDICVEHLKNTHPDIEVRKADSFEEPIDFKTEFLTADFNSYTLLKHKDQKRYSNLIERISNLPSIQFLQVTDSAISKLHLNGLVYQKKMNTGITLDNIQDYINCFAGFYWNEYRWGLKSCYYHRNASYLLFQKNAMIKYNIVPILRSNDGLFEEE